MVAKFGWTPTGGVTLERSSGPAWSSARLQAYWTDYVTGSFTIAPIVTSLGQPATFTDTTSPLSAVSANAAGVMGWFTATQSGGYSQGGLVNGAIHQLGGTALLMAGVVRMYPDASSAIYSGYVTGVNDTAGAVLLTTYVSGGVLYARVQRYYPADPYAPNTWIGLAASTVTITYHAFAYAFN